MPKKNSLPKRKQTKRLDNAHSYPSGYLKAPMVMSAERGALVARFARFGTQTDLTTSTTLEAVQNYVFKLSNVANNSDITGAFDQYRIVRIDVFVTPRVDTSIDANVWADPQIYSALDYDGNAATTVTEVQSYDTAQLHDARKSFMISFVPKVLMAAQAAATTNAVISPAGVWLDCNTTSTEHYGLILATRPQAAITACKVTARYHIEARRSR